jgi:hypothetical protein
MYICSMYILKCSAFDGEASVRYKNECCVDCHERGFHIPVVPFVAGATLESRTTSIDWELGIQGEICCGRFEFVRSLSREWWVRKMAEVNGWDEAKVRSLLFTGSWHATMERRATAATKAANVRSANKFSCVFCGAPVVAEGEMCNKCAL